MPSYSFNKTKKAAIMASILGSSLFAGSAWAANLLVTVPSDYSTSNMAVITGSHVTTNVDSNPIRGALESLNRDPSAYSFIMDGKSKFLLRQYNYSTSSLIPSQVLDADTDWDNPHSATGTITKAANPHSAAGYNGYLYTGDYDLGTISVSKVNETTLKEEVEKSVNLFDDINQYCGGSLSHANNAWVHGEGLTIKGDSLYVVVSVNPEGGYNPYDDSYLMEYKINKDGSLTFNSYMRTVRNPDSVRLESYNNLLMHTGIGGYQNVGEGNSSTNISIADISNGYLSDKATIAAVLPENVKNAGLDFRNMSVWPNGTVYILVYNLSSSGGSHMMVYKTTVANLNSSNPKDWAMVIERNPEGGGSGGTATGWFNSLFTEYYTKRIWGEFGNEIVVYTDGAKEPTLSWTAYNLANNKIYHTFNSVALLKGDSVYGDKALLTKTQEEGLTSPSATTTSVVNLNANMKKADYTKQITGSDKDTLYNGVTSDNKIYTFDADKVIGLGTTSWKDQADLSNNILAAVYAHDGNDITINAVKNTLQLQVHNYVATPVGVYAGNGKNVTINAGKLNVITAGVKGGNSLTNAIMNDAGKDKASKITINGDVNISMSGSYGSNGVAIQKTDRWGEASYESTVENTITINGDLNIKGADSATWGIPVNEENVFSRFNNAGILTQVENSRVDVSGLANMDVYGNGITTNAKNSTVSIGGGEINVPKGMQYSYYTLGAYQGTINVNTGRNGDTVGSNDVKLGGDIFALKTGTINVALTTADSYLNGIVDNGGTVNMWLQNGATWTNVQNNERYEQDNEDVGSNGLSHVTKLVGGSSGSEGVIFQKAASKDITVDNYSGSTMVIYEHDSKTPTSILGGNFTIGEAAADSAITLRTDSSGINMSSDSEKNAVLNALANKLYYTGYADGEKNLSGYVKIAEGLTASAVVKQTGDIQYDAKTCQGSLKDGSVTPGIDYPTEQTKDAFTSQITGEWKQDKEYKLAGVLPVDNATYNFTKNLTTITTEGTSVGAAKDVLLKVNDKNLNLKSGADAVKADAITVTIDAVNNLDITAADKALLAENGGRIIINSKGVLTSKSALAADGSASAIKVKGLADINTGSDTALTAADGSIELAGGSITGVINASGSGRIDINMQDAAAGSNTTKITGDVATADSSIINIGLGNAESSLKGNVAADGESQANIMAKDGASWLGSGNGNVNVTLDSKASWTNTGSSSLKSLKGDGGVVDQTQDGAGDIRVADYSGDVTVLYKHTATTDADGKLSDISFSGNFTIDKAVEGSTITLKTDRSGLSSLTDTANVEKLMSELAKKLFYNDAANNADNLKGTLVIGEGLTAASASKGYGSIEYDANGQAGYKEGSLIRTDPEIIYGSTETAMMRGAKSAMASTALLWRTEANDMQKRLGDIRLAQEESGLWAKYYGGKTSYDANNTKYQTKFNAYQLGCDKNINNNLIFGISMSYNKGNNTYDLGGRGDGKAVSVAAYGTWLGDKGHYADVIIKGSKLDNDYKVYNDMGHKLEGNYDTWGLSLSAEYGRRMSLNNGFYVDPSVEFTVGRINSADYSAASDFLDSQGRNKYMAVNQDAFTSAVARFGLGLGRTTEKGSFYTKLAWAHEFSGDFTTTFAAEGEPTSGTKVDFGGSWCEWQLGGSVNVNDNSYVYATFEKKFGGDAGNNDWRLDAGLRWSF